jgi:hypothetical protein
MSIAEYVVAGRPRRALFRILSAAGNSEDRNERADKKGERGCLPRQNGPKSHVLSSRSGVHC